MVNGESLKIKSTAVFKGVIFDMDGTLTVPSLDFIKIRDEIGVPEGDIVETLNSWPKKKSAIAWEIINRHEADSIKSMKLQNGTKDTILALQGQGVKIAILTRNTQDTVDIFLERSGLVFDMILTRDFPFIKPDPRPLLHIVEALELDFDDVLMVGDYIHDIECGNAAKVRTCHFYNPGTESYGELADFSVTNYDELNQILFS